jgi:cell division protein FtsW
MVIVGILLVVVLVVGTAVHGQKNWIDFGGPFRIQPSEFAKTFFIVSNAYILQKFYFEKWLIKYGVSTALLLALVCLLILQPDFGMTISFVALWAVQLFIYGLPWLFISVLFVFALFGGFGAYAVFPHVQDRINKFLNSGEQNYQVERSLDAFVNGSFFGQGPGNGMVKKFIPDVHTDFIFAAIAEEYGIFSCAILVLVFAYFITRIIRRALDEEDFFVYLSLCGLMMQFTMQVIVNIGVNIRLLPTKGMTLPFISYGGSSMISMAICCGLILAFTKRKYHRDVDYGNLKMI